MNSITFQTVDKRVVIEPIEDGRYIRITQRLRDEKKDSFVCKIDIETIWDMLKDTLAESNPSPHQHGLIRRKNEAIEARTYILRHGG